MRRYKLGAILAGALSACSAPLPPNLCEQNNVVCPDGSKCSGGFCLPPCKYDADCATRRCEADGYCAQKTPPDLPSVPADCYYLDAQTIACEVNTFDPVLNPLDNKCPTGFSLCANPPTSPSFAQICAMPIGTGFFASLVPGYVVDAIPYDKVTCSPPAGRYLPALVGCGQRALDNTRVSVALSPSCGGFTRAVACINVGLDCPGPDIRQAKGDSSGNGILCCK
jgi:hypothetical protein